MPFCSRNQGWRPSLHKVKYLWTTRPTSKLSKKNFGPFTIITRSGTHFITLHLPDSIHSIHPVFHVSQIELLTPSTISNHIQPLPPLVNIEGELKYKIAKILDFKINHWHRYCQLLYLVWWAGYKGTEDKTSWLLATKLGHASELVQDFHMKYPYKPGPHLSLWNFPSFIDIIKLADICFT